LSISDPRSPAEISARWQKALRQLNDAAPGSPESDRLAAQVRDLADEYRAAVARLDEKARHRGSGVAQ
jgi:hypothetical protein